MISIFIVCFVLLLPFLCPEKDESYFFSKTSFEVLKQEPVSIQKMVVDEVPSGEVFVNSFG